MDKEPSWLAYMLAIAILISSLVGGVLIIVQLLQGYDNFGRSIDGLAAWVQDILDDPKPSSEEKQLD